MTSVPCLAWNFWMRSFGGDFRGWTWMNQGEQIPAWRNPMLNKWCGEWCRNFPAKKGVHGVCERSVCEVVALMPPWIYFSGIPQEIPPGDDAGYAMPWISPILSHHALEGMQGLQLKSVQNCLANQCHRPSIHVSTIYDHSLATLISWPENVNEGHMENPWCVWTWISIQVVAFESSNN